MESRSARESKKGPWRRPWLWLVVALVLAAGAGSLRLGNIAGSNSRPLELSAPSSVQTSYGTWIRSDLKRLQLTGISSAQQGMTFVYSGPDPIMAHVVRMKTADTAFEAVQKWRTTPGMAAFYQGDLFIVVSYQDPRAGQAFAREFLKNMAR